MNVVHIADFVANKRQQNLDSLWEEFFRLSQSCPQDQRDQFQAMFKNMCLEMELDEANELRTMIAD